MLKRVVVVAVLLGAVGPLLLTPVVIWLDYDPHDLRTARQWESVFRWLWPTSPMLMTGGGAKPMSLAYIVLLLLTAGANPVLFGLLGALVGGCVVCGRFVFRKLRRPQ